MYVNAYIFNASMYILIFFRPLAGPDDNRLHSSRWCAFSLSFPLEPCADVIVLAATLQSVLVGAVARRGVGGQVL